MQRLPHLPPSRRGDVVIHLALFAAAVMTVWNFFATLQRLTAKSNEVAQVLFHESAPVSYLARSTTNATPPGITNADTAHPVSPQPVPAENPTTGVESDPLQLHPVSGTAG